MIGRGELCHATHNMRCRRKIGFLSQGLKRWFRRQFHGSNKSVTTLGKCFNETWLLLVVVQGLAEFLDRRVQAVIEINESVFGPEPFLQILACDDLTGMFQKHREDMKRLDLQPNLSALSV